MQLHARHTAVRTGYGNLHQLRRQACRALLGVALLTVAGCQDSPREASPVEPDEDSGAEPDEDSGAEPDEDSGAEPDEDAEAEPPLVSCTTSDNGDGTWNVACDDGRPTLRVGPGLDLSGVDLSYADLSGINLEGANLEGARIYRVHLEAARLAGAVLADVVLNGSSLDGADLREADLHGATFGTYIEESIGTSARNADFSGADFHDTSLNNLYIEGANFSGANLRGATLPAQASGVNMSGADLSGASLSDSQYEDVNFDGARFASANIVLARFYRCTFVETNFEFALLDYVGFSHKDSRPNLRGAKFHRAKLRSVTFGAADLRDAVFSSTNVVSMYLAGADLTGAVLSTSLRDLDLDSARAYDLPRCPDALPTSRWTCAAQQNGRFMLLGPRIDLAGADLTGISLAGASLAGALSAGLVACPAALPSNAWKCVPAAGGYALAGPQARLAGTDLRNADLSHVDLSEADLTSVDLTGAALNGADLGFAHMLDAVVDDVASCPAGLPTSQWTCESRPAASFSLVAPASELPAARDPSCRTAYNQDDGVATVTCGDGRPAVRLGPGLEARGANLRGAYLRLTNAYIALDLSDADLTGADLRGSTFGTKSVGGDEAWANLRGTILRAADLSYADLHYTVIEGADLTDADLTYANLNGVYDWTGVRLSGARLPYANLQRNRPVDIIGCPAILPGRSWACVTQPNGRQALVGPGLILTDADLGGTDLTGVDLTGTTTELHGCPAVLPTPWICTRLDSGLYTLVLPAD